LSRRIKAGVFDYVPCECQSESLRRAQEIYSGLTQGLRTQTFANFQPGPETQEAHDLARDFSANPTGHHILTLKGGFGTGKTHLLQAIGWVSLEHGRQPKFVSVARYLDKLRATFADDSPVSFESVYRPLEAAQMLLLDDIGAERLTNWGQEQLYKVVNHRYQERLPMAVSMNLDEKQAVDIYGERTADRLLDTHSGRVQVVTTGSRSFRTQAAR
jgi:DNA replication protein DnaC